MKYLTIFLLSLFCFQTGYSQYTYDGNGNLASDNNKRISSIHYNHLNLVDSLVYEDGRTIIYLYSASGQKLLEHAIAADGSTVKKRDYANHFLYTGDTLREIQHEDGRAVPNHTASSWEYQYHIKDHLGNVRTTITSKHDTDPGMASFETSNTNEEQSKFLGYENARLINSPLFDHTKTGVTHYSQRLNGSANEKYGIARSLSVMPGDTVKLEVYAKYVDPVSSNLQPALTSLLSYIALGGAPVGTVVDGANYATSGNTPFSFAGLNGTSVETGTNPKAYLNWLVFDRNYVFRSGGYKRMSDAAKENGSNVDHEKLEKNLVITEPGYVYVYVSNEEETPLEVFFDDLTVTHVKGQIIRQSDYDPFGLTFNEYAKEDVVPDNFLYNQKELQKDFDLNWYDYGARMYDAALGRWHAIDPKAEKYADWSPYNYVLNNPIKYVDPDGREIVLDGDKDRIIQGIINDLKAIPQVRDAIKCTEDSENIVTIHIRPGRKEVSHVFNHNDALPKGEKGKDGGVERKGTGKGSAVDIILDPLKANPGELPVYVGEELAHAYKMACAKFTLETFDMKGDDGETYTMYTTSLHTFNFANVIRGHYHLPYELGRNGMTFIDKDGNPVASVSNIVLGIKELEKINASGTTNATGNSSPLSLETFVPALKLLNDK